MSDTIQLPTYTATLRDPETGQLAVFLPLPGQDAQMVLAAVPSQESAAPSQEGK